MLEALRIKKPVIHCITNHVVSNFQANGLLALGASPIMGEAPEEAAELTAIANALSLNIGTLNSQSLESMLISGKTANSHRIPVVLDPVGAGASTFRTDAVRKILDQVKVTVLRCNAGELAAIAGAEWNSKGVDAGDGTADISELARNTARELGLIIAVTGKVDIVTDGEHFAEIPYGSEIMASITGAGCLLSSAVAAFLAIKPEEAFNSTVEALRIYAIAGELASKDAPLPGEFQQAFLNRLFSVRSTNLTDFIRRKDGSL